MTEYRLYPSTNGPSTVFNDNQVITVGTEFYATSSGLAVNRLYYWRGATTQGTGTVRGQLYRIDGVSTGTALLASPVTFDVPSGLGWQSIDLPTAIPLTSGQRYRVAVWFGDKIYAATTAYWTTGAGSAGITNGPLTAPSNAAATGSHQSSFVYGGTNPVYPSNGGGANYWVDVGITDTFTSAPIVGAGADVALQPTGTVLNRTASESSGGSTITARAWTIIAGPTDVGSTLSTSAAVSWTPTVAGIYTLQYAATNAIGVGSDTVQVTVATIPWTHQTSGIAARNGTTSHTVSLGFTSTSGRLLVLVVSGSVTTTAAGWAKQLAPVNTGELAVLTKVSTGESSVTLTHNGSDYPLAWTAFEFPAGSNYVAGAQSAVASGTPPYPTLSGLLGVPVTVIAARARVTTGASTATTTWTSPFLPVAEVFEPGGSTAGGWQAVGFASDVTDTTVTPVGASTFPGTGWNSNHTLVTFAVEAAATGGPAVAAGVDRSVVVGDSVSLSASATPTSGHTITGYSWTILSGGGSLTSATTSTPTYTAPGSGAGRAILRLTVTETGGGATGTDILVVGYGANIVAAEAQLPGVPRGTWDLPVGSLGGVATLQGFADGFSYNIDETVNFKIAQSDTAGWSAEVYRLGWYTGNGARLMASGLTPDGTQLTASQAQPTPGDCDPETAVISADCSNWSTTLTWTPPAWAPSGIYLLKLNRTGGGASHVMFVLRDDARAADLMVMPADSTWHAYNAFGGMGSGLLAGNSLYFGTAVAQTNAGAARYVSYNRPIVNRAAANPGQAYGAVEWSTFFTAEYPMIRFLERNGIDYKSYSCLDAAGDPTGALLDNVDAAMFVGHNEYWSDGMRAGWEAAKAGGTSIFACAGNEVFWRLVGHDQDSAGRPRTWECFKSTIAGRGSVGRSDWTGTWRDPDGAGKGGNLPENTFTGTIFAVNGPDLRSLRVPFAGGYSQQPIWRDTAAAALTTGEWVSAAQILGFEWDTFGPAGVSTGAAAFMAAPHPQARFCSAATYSITSGLLLTDAGDVYDAAGTAEHRVVVHPSAAGGGITFGAGTVNWALGVDNANTYQQGADNTSAVIQQATLNMLVDMGVTPTTVMSGLVTPSPQTWFAATTEVTNQPSSFVGWPPGTTLISTITQDDTYGISVGSAGGGTTVEVSGLPSGGGLDIGLFVVAAGGVLTPLPDFVGLELSPIQNAPGAVRIDYPAQGRNFDALQALYAADRPVEVSIWLNGRDAGSLRAILREASGDKVDPHAVWTFAGTFLEGRMERALVGLDASNAKKETVFAGATAGTMIRTLMLRAQGRGVLTDITWDSFSNTVDSRGQVWDLQASPTFTPKDTLLDVLDTLVEMGMCDWEITPDHELHLYRQGTGGRDLTLSDPPVILWAGLNNLDGPRKHSLQDTVGALLIEGREGLYQYVTNPTAVARMGVLEEGVESAGNIDDIGSLTAYGQARSTVRGTGQDELTHGLVFGVGDPLPLSGFHIADWVYSGSDAGLDRRRIRQWVLTVRPGEQPQGSISLSDLFTERALQLSRRISALERGSSVVGTSVATVESDTIAPTVPTGLVAASLAYIDLVSGQPLAQISAAWNAVTTNANGTAIDDLAGYRVRWQFNQPGYPSGWQSAGTAQDTSLTFSALPQNVLIELQVAAFDQRGNQSGWSASYPVVTGTDSDAPPTPSTPTVVNHLGVLDVFWDGLGSAGEAMPSDFAHCEVHRSLAAGFTPDVTTRVALDLRSAGGVSYETQPGQFGQAHYFRLIAVDLLGNRSAPSAIGSATPNPVVDLSGALIEAAQLAEGAVTTPAIAPEAVTTAHLSVAQFSENALRNGGFEDADLADDTQAAAWAPYTDSGVTHTWARVTNESRSGVASMKLALAAASGYAEIASQTIPVQAGEHWYVEVTARGSRAVSGAVRMIASWGASETSDDDGVFVHAAQDITVAWGDALTAQVTVPATVGGSGLTPRWMRLVVRCGNVSGDSAALDIWLDDARARKVVGRAIIADAAIGTAQIEDLAVSNAKFGSVDVGKLTAGTVTATMLMSGLIRTAASGARAELDGSGFRLYDSAGTNTVDLNASDGSAFISGRFEASSGGDDRIVVQPTGAGASGGSLAEISFFANPTLPAYMNAFDSGSGLTGMGLNSGNSNGSGTYHRQSTLKLYPSGFELFWNSAPGDSAGVNHARGARLFGDDDYCGLQLYNDSGVQRSKLELNDATINAELLDSGGDRDGGFIWLRAGDTGDTYFGKSTSSYDMFLKFGDTDGIFLQEDSSNFLHINGSNTALAKGGVVKSFVIPHPVDPDRYLVHGCTESPVAAVEYVGAVTIVGNEAVAELPAYFEALTEPDGRSVIASAEIAVGPFNLPMTPTAATGPIVDGRFRVLCVAPDGTRVHWRVYAARKNAVFPVEPRRDEVQVGGGGPYRFIVPEE